MEKRMYGLTNYQLTGIQKGIQFLHGVVEYSQMVNRIGGYSLDIYNDWANNWKTVILLNGGTTNHKISLEDGLPFGTLNQHVLTLQQNGIHFATFNEPDLGDQLTAVVFIVDERVFNRKKYPDFEDWVIENYGDLIEDQKVYQSWIKLVGGEKNAFLRDFLKNFRLA